MIPGATGWEFPSLKFLLAPRWSADVVAGPRAIPMALESQDLLDDWVPMSSHLSRPTVSWWASERFPGEAPQPVPTDGRIEGLWLPMRRKQFFRPRAYLLEAQVASECAFQLWGVPAAPCHVVEGDVETGLGQLVLVGDGVVLRAGPAPTPTLRNRVTICSAASLDFDLSGFAPVENDSWWRLLKALETWSTSSGSARTTG